MIIAIMVLSLGGSMALIAFRSSTQEVEISRYSEHEMSAQYLAESGVDQVISWTMEPASFPEEYDDYEEAVAFFTSLPTRPCEKNSEDPDLSIADEDFLSDINGPFSELKVMGEIQSINLYAPLGQSDPPVDGDRRLCTLEVTAVSGKGSIKKIRVDLARSSIGPITAGIQGVVSTASILPLWTHWGEIHYAAVGGDGDTPDANIGLDILRVPRLDEVPPLNFNGQSYSSIPEDYVFNADPVAVIRVEENIGPLIPDNGDTFSERPNVFQEDNDGSLDAADPDDLEQVDLRRFLRANGEVYTVSSEVGMLEKNGVVGTFDDFFLINGEGESPGSRLVWIMLGPDSSDVPLTIDGGKYKGYFFFSGGITILGGKPGREISATTPEGDPLSLSGINLEGLFYTNGSMTIQDSFKTYGAFFSRGGFTGSGTQALEVWYNSSFADAVFPGIRSVTPLSGTWATLASEES